MEELMSLGSSAKRWACVASSGYFGDCELERVAFDENVLRTFPDGELARIIES
jgi:hypothetical protein